MSMTLPFLKTVRGKQIALALVFIFLSAIGIDQVTKRHAQASLMTWEHPTNLDMFKSTVYPVASVGKPDAPYAANEFFIRMNFQYERNRGAAFSMLSNLPDNVRVPFFYLVTLICVVYISFYLRTLPINFHLTRFGLVMILAGAIGNFIDRLIQGYVIDFISVGWNIFGWRHDFAVFNVADIAINVGIIAFILEMILRRKPLIADFGSAAAPAKVEG
ncbi:signal peptidase II [Oligoflexus tunisiensis]|uniref:signal peptidase II n=1 Tax=Oligoflexus tunisiensis TaxID=708132 RepID=UPI000AB6A65F|nr:signal peptidase II [Oligoflexus tunisiensis]